MLPAFSASRKNSGGGGKRSTSPLERVTYDRDAGIITRSSGEVQRLPPPPEFLREALKAGSILEYYKQFQKFPGE